MVEKWKGGKVDEWGENEGLRNSGRSSGSIGEPVISNLKSVFGNCSVIGIRPQDPPDHTQPKLRRAGCKTFIPYAPSPMPFQVSGLWFQVFIRRLL
jgi:hypothetical protein